MSSAKGLLSINHAKHDPRSIRKGIWHYGDPPYYPMSAPAPRSVPERLGFSRIETQTSSGPFVRLILPYWFVAATTSLLSGIWLLRWWHDAPQRRKRLGLCSSCGYDLRASPGRCPECGTPAAVTVEEQVA